MSTPGAGRTTGPDGPNPTSFPWIKAVVVAALVVGVGLAIALAGGRDDDSTASEEPAFGPVSTSGSALAPYDRGLDDPTAGKVAPTVVGTSPTGDRLTIGAAGKPTLLVFVAHWCPHCQAEVPRIVQLAEAGELDGVRLVAIATGTNTEAPNFPPVAWLEREGWPGEVLLDDEQFTAAEAFGLAGYPFLVALDADGKVVARSSGELAPEDVVALAALTRTA